VSQLDILVAVDLQHIAPLFVDGQPPHHVAPVKSEILDHLQAAATPLAMQMLLEISLVERVIAF
jgi:hypothetical protein